MTAKKGIVLLLGNNGGSFFIFDGKEFKTRFISEFNDETKEEIAKSISEFSKLPIYVVLDTIEQSYKKKNYPKMRPGDFARIAKRDMAADGDKESLKNFIALKPPKPKKNFKPARSSKTQKIECLFVSCTTSPAINSWVEFLQNLPNRLYGIYALPLEIGAVFTSLGSFIKGNFKDLELKHQEIFCLITQTKSGGIRQAVFANGNLVFTRMVNYNFAEKDVADKFYQDILSTFEYLKRIYIDLTLHDFHIIDILPAENHQALLRDDNVTSLNSVNLSPEDLGKKFGLKNISADFQGFFDQVFTYKFLSSKPILKFANIKIKVFDQFYSTLLLARLSSFGLSILFTLLASYFVITNLSSGRVLFEKTEKKRSLSSIQEDLKKQLVDYNYKLPGGKEIGLPEIIDIGSYYQKFGKSPAKPWDYYEKLGFLSKSFYLVESYSYSPSKNNSQNNSAPSEMFFGDMMQQGSAPQKEYSLQITGKLINESGEIDVLFKRYDKLLSEAEFNLKGEIYKFSELPKNIDFNKKYYDLPVDLMITKKVAKNEPGIN